LRQEGKALEAEGYLFADMVVEKGRKRALDVLRIFHEENPLRGGLPLEELRQSFPRNTGPGLAEAVIKQLSGEGILAREKGLVRLSEFQRHLAPDQGRLRDRIREILQETELAPPGLDELTSRLGAEKGEVNDILRFMEVDGEVLGLEGGLFFWVPHVHSGGERVVEALGGSSGLGPADFREVLGVTRKYLLPLLRYMDTVGITTRRGDDRIVAESLPPEWGTSGFGNA
jgi:selenocysteine-specific elongation factor